MKKSLFISFASIDQKVVLNLAGTLERDGVSCWIASRDVAPGENWSMSIIEAIDDCPAMLLVLSNASNQSIHVANEIERGVSKGKALYIVRIEDVKPSRVMELHVSSRQWTDAFRPPIEPSIHMLAESIRDKLGITTSLTLQRAESSQTTPQAKTTQPATSKLAAFAAKIAKKEQPAEASPHADLQIVITQALAEFNVSESGSMGSFYMDEGNARHIYRRLREELHGVPEESVRAALVSRLNDDDPLTKWKAMKLLLMLGQVDTKTARSYWETQARWIPRQLIFDLLKTLPVAERMALLSDIAQFDENGRIRRSAFDEFIAFRARDYPETLVPAVQQGLRDDNDDVRSAAVSAAAEIDDEVGAEIALERLRDDSSWSVRVAACEVLGKCAGVDAIPLIVDALQNARINDYVAGKAAKAIAKRFGVDPVVHAIKAVAAHNIRESMIKVVLE